MREKLIELFEGSLRCAGDVCGETGDCSKCQYDKYGANCGYAIRADYFIANGVTIQKWIPLSERKPGRDELVLVFFDGMRDTPAAIQVIYGWCISGSATHWMPLPQPPKGE